MKKVKNFPLPCFLDGDGDDVTELEGCCRIIGYVEVATWGDDTSVDGDAAEVDPTEPGSLKPCVPSSG